MHRNERKFMQAAAAFATLIAFCGPSSLWGQSDVADGYRLAPKAFRAAVESVAPALVAIETFGGVSPGKEATPGISRVGQGATTGLIVSPEGHIVASTFNFIRNPPVITVTLSSGERHVAKLLGRDETRQICLLKIDGVADLPVAQSAPRDSLRIGQWAVTVGVGFNPKAPAVSVGIISALDRMSGRAVQTDANTSPANYGGPLLDVEGRVIGVCVPLAPGSGSAGVGVGWYDSGIGFAIPLDGADEIIERLKSGEVLKAGKLGVQIAPGDDGMGAVVKKVMPKSGAAAAGVEIGDRIVQVDGQKVLDVPHLMVLVARHLAGDSVAIVIERGEKKIEMSIELLANITAESAEEAAGEKEPAKDEPADEMPDEQKPAKNEPKP